nr:hypothetical protein [uncultured Chryseobacterium sp.]
MDDAFYLEKFHSAIDPDSQEKIDHEGLKVSIDIVLESVALKLYKPHWSGDQQSPLHAKGRIFFSVWINDKTLKEDKIYYNIHALKLRELKDYKISSRNFAQDFRNEFYKYHKDWPNVSVEYGPLTLMQGWIDLKKNSISKDIKELVHSFLRINSIVDRTLEQYQK